MVAMSENNPAQVSCSTTQNPSDPAPESGSTPKSPAEITLKAGSPAVKIASDPKRTAVHEAGHAVVAFVLGRPVHDVSIRARGRFAGLCKFQKGKGKPTDDFVDREMQISLAGVAAEIRHLGKADVRGAQSDLMRAMELAMVRSGAQERAERLVRRTLNKALHLLDQPGRWPAVLVIMDELIAKETISGRAVRHAVEEALKMG